MEKFIIIEVGSTTTKAYFYETKEIKNLDRVTIEFKNHFKSKNELNEEDKKTLFDFVNSVKIKNTYVFGTSIFRNLNTEQRISWLKEFKVNTDLDFNIVTADMENELTVYGAIANVDYKGKIAIMIGGGGSTELSIVENGQIIEKANSSFGAIDTTEMFPDLKEDYATSDYKHMIEETKKLVNVPKNKADLLIIAGGDYIYFYDELNYNLPKNKFYENPLQPYCISIDCMDTFDKKFFYELSLNEVCQRTNNAGWWNGARGMRLCVKSLCDFLGTKYVIPTRITMVYGLVEKIKKNEI